MHTVVATKKGMMSIDVDRCRSTSNREPMQSIGGFYVGALSTLQGVLGQMVILA